MVFVMYSMCVVLVRFSERNTPRYLNSVSGGLGLNFPSPSTVGSHRGSFDPLQSEIKYLSFLANFKPMSSTKLSGPLIHGPDMFPCFRIDHASSAYPVEEIL